MKAVVFHAIGDISVEDVPDPKIQEPTDAIIRLTSSALCGTDLHFIRGTFTPMQEGTILGHEGVGIVEQLGDDVRNLAIGDRVVVSSTIGCGNCAYCRDGYYAQCDVANPNGKQAGTSFFGGPSPTGPFNGLQAEKARIPFAPTVLTKLPREVSDEQAIVISDIFPTGYFGADLADIKDGHSVAVFGCGPVGLCAIVSAKLFAAGRVFAVDSKPDRLEKARFLGAECINFEREDPVDTLQRLTGGIGPDRAIDAVGIDASHAHDSNANEKSNIAAEEREARENAPETNPDGDNWHPGDAPSQALQWAVQSLAKAGTLAIVGVYPPGFNSFPIGMAMNRNLTLKMGNCNHSKYIPKLVDMTRTGQIDPSEILSQSHPITEVLEAYRAFDLREEGWLKVEIDPES
ncbi:zinc-dependent alcohol dehydrogenase [Chromohalobacter israelensis]|uniref:zinc-dependent alcohol dehydrogenase n=1 Tax=Chromohalobacter israelensis TaxID=141390 RepID=UPI00265C5F56|nr:zinc-dependent alcohol dehydrogenase [Chromohalobacter salexigens]MDO0946871.1 zinc-dependent alcohol dehydrogenase [Chromohalobacter salexigens]